MLIIPRRHTGIPPIPEIDISNPIGGLILGGVAFSQGVARMHRVSANTGAGSPPLVGVNTSFGGAEYGTNLPAATFDDYLFDDGNFSGETLDWTAISMVCWNPTGNTAGVGNLFAIRVSTPSDSAPYVAIQASGNDGLRSYHRAGSAVLSAYIQPLELTPAAVVYRQGQGTTFYCGSMEPIVVASTTTQFYGGLSYQSGLYFGAGDHGGRASFGYVIPEALDDLTLREWTRQPFQIFKQPEPTRIYSFPSGPIIRPVKAWNGTAFQDCDVKVYQTGAWHLADVHTYTGGSW